MIDWNYHWFHTADWLGCTTPTGVNATLCPDEATCAQNCFVQGDTNYTNNGVSTLGDTLTMYQYTIDADGEAQNASPRLYLLGDDGNYEMLQLLGQELTFTVDLSTLPCGENGALYLGEMDKTGGRNPYNTGGASLGSGYCDAQCPVQTWKNGTLNTNGSGYCCNEMDSKFPIQPYTPTTLWLQSTGRLLTFDDRQSWRLTLGRMHLRLTLAAMATAIEMAVA